MHPEHRPCALAVATWDFSWLERRWPGAGYEDWGAALDQLLERGYDAVRIDAFPHLAAADPLGEWTLRPWCGGGARGSPGPNRVSVQPELSEFVAACRDRGLRVALTSWFRDDTTGAAGRIDSAEAAAAAWDGTLAQLRSDGLLPAVLHADLGEAAAECPWVKARRAGAAADGDGLRRAVAALRGSHPEIPFGFSAMALEGGLREAEAASFLDVFEHTTWLEDQNDGAFSKAVAEAAQREGGAAGWAAAAWAEKVYRARPEAWRQLINARIASVAAVSAGTGLPLSMPQGWAAPGYRDGPLVDRGWIKEVCENALISAAGTGRWALLATCGCCGPQFAGFWRDAAWHRSMTTLIRRSAIQPVLHDTRLVRRMCGSG